MDLIREHESDLAVTSVDTVIWFCFELRVCARSESPRVMKPVTVSSLAVNAPSTRSLSSDKSGDLKP